MNRTLLSFLLLAIFTCSSAIAQERKERIRIAGEIVTAIISADGDTMIIADLDDVSITSPRSFDNSDEFRLYNKYKKYALRVYPMAKEAITILRDVEEATQDMKRRKRKRYIKKKYKELKEEFTDPLKKLYKTEGMILVKMIERELGKPFYDLMKEMKGSVTASYWNQLGSFYDYDFKTGYVEGKDPILDAVLYDFDISHGFKK